MKNVKEITRQAGIVMIVPIIIIAVLVLVGFYFWQSGKKMAGEPQTSGLPMKVAHEYWPGTYWVEIADKKGWFEQAGLNVELVDVNENYLPSVQAWVDGNIDVNQPVFFDFIKHRAEGADLVAVAVSDLSFDGDGIVAKNEIKSITDLRGKRIGLERGTFLEFMLSIVLERNGMTLADVVLVENSASETQPFISGKLDAIATWDPYMGEAINKGDGYRIFGTSEIPGLVSDVIGFHQSFIEERPEDVQALVNVWHKTTEFIKENPDEAFGIVAEINGVTPDEVRAFAETDKILDLRDNLTAFSYAAGFDSLHGAARRINDFMRTRGIADTQLESTEFIDAQFVRALR